MRPSDSNKIFNMALRRKRLPTPALVPCGHTIAFARVVRTLWLHTPLVWQWCPVCRANTSTVIRIGWTLTQTAIGLCAGCRSPVADPGWCPGCPDTFMHFRPALCFILVYNCGLTVRNKRMCYVMLCYVLSLDLEWLGIECLVQSKQNSLWYRDGIHG